MKFSNEAMRDVLLFFEEKVTYTTKGISDHRRKSTFNINNIVEDKYFYDLFSKHKYTKDELYYTIEKMIEGKILNANGTSNTHYQITDISFYGVQLLEKIRPEPIWGKNKICCK